MTPEKIVYLTIARLDVKFLFTAGFLFKRFSLSFNLISPQNKKEIVTLTDLRHVNK